MGFAWQCISVATEVFFFESNTFSFTMLPYTCTSDCSECWNCLYVTIGASQITFLSVWSSKSKSTISVTTTPTCLNLPCRKASWRCHVYIIELTSSLGFSHSVKPAFLNDFFSLLIRQSLIVTLLSIHSWRDEILYHMKISVYKIILINCLLLQVQTWWVR